MKKIYRTFILILLWCGSTNAAPIKNFNVSIACNSTGFYLQHLDRSKEDYFQGFASDTGYDGKKGPDFNLMISLENKSEEKYGHKWQGEIIYLDRNGKKLYKPRGLYQVGTGSNLSFTTVAVNTNSTTNYMEILNIGEWKTTDSKEDYYKVTKTRVENIKEALSKKNKQLDLFQNYDHFKISSTEYICFK